MLQDPFSDPFRLGRGPSQSDIFKRRGGGVRAPRKPETSSESEPAPELQLDTAPETAEEGSEEPEGEKVVLKNPKWEIEKVGFNEETDISVEAELPEEHAHKTRVEFEIFAKTPKGLESISKGHGHIEGGRAKARIPVYIPQYRDEDGNFLPKVEFFFSAKHSQSDPCKDEEAVKVVDGMADLLIASHTLRDVTFATGKSFMHPRQADAMKSLVGRIKDWKSRHPEGKLAVFGHADAVGEEEANKKLSERRARAVHAFLVRDATAWNALYNEEKWGLATSQDMLRHLGHDPGASDGMDGPKTQAAVKSFQGKAGLPQSGQADAPTREALYKTFMSQCNTITLGAKDFDSIDGKPFGGCSEFNLAKESRGGCEANRRVTVHLLKSNRNFPIQYPCKQGDATPCRKQVGRKGDRRTKGFGCLFYDKLVLEVPNPQDEKPKAPIANLRWSMETRRCGEEVKLLAESSLPDGTEVGIKMGTEEQVCDQAKARIQGGKLEFIWTVRGVAFAFDENKKAKPEVEVYVEVTAIGEKYAADKNLKVKKLVEAKPEEFKDIHKWGTKTIYTVKGHFFQGINGNKAKVNLKKKVMQTWGATYVTVTPAGIHDAGSGFPWAGWRWASCPDGSMVPDKYWDKGKWHKIDYEFDGEFSTLPIIKTGEKFHWVESTAYEYPGHFAEYKWETYQEIRETWIKDSKKRWTGVHGLKRKACASPNDIACCTYDVEMEFDMEKVEFYGDEVVCLAPGPLRSNAGLMFYDDSRIPMCAHEVGHLVGQPDEYKGGAVNTSVNGDGAKNGLDNTTLMGGNLSDPNNRIKTRHYDNFATQMRKLYKNNVGKDEEWIVVKAENK